MEAPGISQKLQKSIQNCPKAQPYKNIYRKHVNICKYFIFNSPKRQSINDSKFYSREFVEIPIHFLKITRRN
jgi:hypothetical protein